MYRGSSHSLITMSSEEQELGGVFRYRTMCDMSEDARLNRDSTPVWWRYSWGLHRSVFQWVWTAG